jgi:hypothetical protein
VDEFEHRGHRGAEEVVKEGDIILSSKCIPSTCVHSNF